MGDRGISRADAQFFPYLCERFRLGTSNNAVQPTMRRIYPTPRAERSAGAMSGGGPLALVRHDRPQGGGSAAIVAWRQVLPPGYFCICILMLLWLVFLRFFHSSAAVNGAVGWINLGFINLQPLEVTKLALVIYLAYVLDHRDGKLVKGKIKDNLSHPAILAAFLMCLVIVEPDLGGTAILFMITLVMFSVSGIPARLALTWLIGIALVIGLVVLIIIIWNPEFLQKSYQFQRLMSFLHPFELERKGGAQLVNSYYAIHNGGVLGVGLGNSMQKRGYLPEPYTDFILSITAEEVGVILTILLVGLLFYLMLEIMNVGIHAVSQFDALICFGVATIIFTEAFFNIGAVLGLLPITGVTLPFISYGGSSMIVLTAAIGLVLNVSANEKMLKEKDETIA